MLAVPAANAGAIPQGYLDNAQWEAAVGEFTTIDFTGFAAETPITDQFASEGVTFLGGTYMIFFSPAAFPNDEWGLDGNGAIHLEFSEPMHWIAVDWPGLVLQIDLYRDGQLLSQTLAPGDFFGNFIGLHSPEAFDRAVLINPHDGAVYIDDLHFAVPTPGATVLLLFPLLRRRRLRT